MGSSNIQIFSWVQNKIHGRQGINKTSIYPPNKYHSLQSGAQKEEFSDWPNGFLSIGTLGNNKDLKDENTKDNNNNNNNLLSQNHIKDLTLEEVRQLQKELSALISNDNLESFSSQDEGDDQRSGNNGDLDHTNNVPNKAKDVYLENNTISNNVMIGKKSLSFLLKKIIVCGGGLPPSPSLRDPTLSPPMTRMEKILRAILHKKLYPQSPCQSMSKKRYLASTHKASSNYDDDDDDRDHDDDSDDGTDGSKWVKTDSEYIVLEI